MSPSFYTPIGPGDRGLACSIGEDLPSSHWPVSGGPEARGERDIEGTFGAVEDLEDSLLQRPELEDTCGVPVSPSPRHFKWWQRWDHLRRAGDARGKFPLFQIDT